MLASLDERSEQRGKPISPVDPPVGADDIGTRFCAMNNNDRPSRSMTSVVSVYRWFAAYRLVPRWQQGRHVPSVVISSIFLRLLQPPKGQPGFRGLL